MKLKDYLKHYDSVEEARRAQADYMADLAERQRAEALESALERVDSEAQLMTSGLLIDVRILDARVTGGTVEYHLQPISGEGTAWLNEARVVFNDWCS